MNSSAASDAPPGRFAHTINCVAFSLNPVRIVQLTTHHWVPAGSNPADERAYTINVNSRTKLSAFIDGINDCHHTVFAHFKKSLRGGPKPGC